MLKSKIQNVIIHKSKAESHFTLNEINDFYVSVIKRHLWDMQITWSEKTSIIDKIIRILKSEYL